MDHPKFTHLDSNGKAHMVDVGSKPITSRVAVAQAVVRLSDKTLGLLLDNALPKGDVLACARIGAIMAAKRTAELIPLCHTLPLSMIGVNFEISRQPPSIRIISEARCEGRTGVEMEAIIAAQSAAAIIYDMCKAVQRDIIIDNVRLLYKNGGKSGEFRAAGFENVGS